MITIAKLPYEENALEPILSEEAVKLHYEKHHQGYADAVNKLIKGTIYESANLERIVKNSRGSIFNSAAQVWNHDFYWSCLTPKSDTWNESGEIRNKIEEQFKSYEAFVQQFNDKASKLFGSGWCWLIEKSNMLEIREYPNADTPLVGDEVVPLLCIDLWEHAFYPTYQNDKKKYLSEIWKIVNWDFVRRKYTRH
ncbi:MAG: superoxide dismutase [Nitrosopumilaceae archaeon]